MTRLSHVLQAAADDVPPHAWLSWSGLGSIGWESDEAGTIVAGDAPAGTPLDVLRRADATSVDGNLVDQDGVVALRWFELQAHDLEEFVRLSEAAWPGFEAGFDATILGLFLDAGAEAPHARTLLVTRYASLAEWERSRRPGAEADTAFRRRHELTTRTVVRVATRWRLAVRT